jgi:putative oxidoreductase
MTRLIQLHADIFSRIQRLAEPALPLLLRIVFAATLLRYYWNSAGTKVWDRDGAEGIFDVLTLEAGVYAQMFPKQFEAVGYNSDNLGFIYSLIALAGTYAEFLLPLMIVVGLFTRLAALGMIGFVFVQTAVDVTGHGRALGALFDTRYELIDERTLWMFGLLLIVIKGAGLVSLDRLVGTERPSESAPATI